MNYLSVITVILFFVLYGCKTDEREKLLAEKAAQLDLRQQELDVKQQSLALKEEELLKKEKLIDSISNRTAIDTLAGLHPGLPGLYKVVMRCIETTCPESAVGDSKSEQWELAVAENQVIVKAMSDQKIVRIYKGSYTGNKIELHVQSDTALMAGNMIVRLQETKENKLKGTREITRQDNCRILYDLNLQKQ